MRIPRRLLLVRHGPTPWNEAGRYQGWSDPGLSQAGRRTVAALAPALDAAGLRAAVGLVWCSDLRRAVATARILFPKATIRFDERLREMAFGDFEGRTYQENLQRSPPEFRRWLARPEEHAPPGGETLASLEGRVAEWLAHAAGAAGPHETVRAVTHGGVIRAIRAGVAEHGFGAAADAEELPASPAPGEAVLLEAGRCSIVRPRPPSSTNLHEEP